MRQHNILTRILLILSIINFALAAPAAVREKPEARSNEHVTRNVTTMSQKRWDSLDERSTDVPEPDHGPPPNPESIDMLLQIPWSQILQMTQQHRHAVGRPPLGPPPQDIPSLAPDTLSSTDDHHVRPGWPAGSRLPAGSMRVPVAGFLSPPPPPPPFRVPDYPGPSDARPPGPPASSLYSDTLLSTGNNYAPPSPGISTGPRLPAWSIPEAGFLSPFPPPLLHPSQPGPSEGHSGLPGFSVNSDALTSTGSSPASPGLDPEIHSLLNTEELPTELEFWDMFLKGRIRRRMSNSDGLALKPKVSHGLPIAGSSSTQDG